MSADAKIVRAPLGSASGTRSEATLGQHAQAVRAAAHRFIEMGWVPVRVEPRGKVPAHGKGWQELRPTHDEIDSGAWDDTNLGALLGAASGHLVDIDLDCDAAVKLAPLYLPPTWRFGRKSKPASHWLYIAEGATTRQFRDTNEEMMVELRAESTTGSGAQTVMPPSVYANGEPIEWDADALDASERPLRIDASVLLRAVVKLARATLLVNDGVSVDEATEFVANYKPKPIARPTVSTSQRRSGDVIGRARKYLARMPEAVSGQGGHLALYRAAIVLVRGFELDEDTAMAILEEDFNPRCHPAWKPKELAHKVTQAATRSTVPRGWLLGGGAR